MPSDVQILHAEKIQSILGFNRLEKISDTFDNNDTLNLIDLNQLTEKEIKSLEPHYSFIRSEHSDVLFGWMHLFKINTVIEPKCKNLTDLLKFIEEHADTCRLTVS